MATDIRLVDGVYPSGKPYKQIFIGGVEIGNLSCVEGGFTAIGWHQTVVSFEVGIEKLRAEAIRYRKGQIHRIQSEIESLSLTTKGKTILGELEVPALD